MEATPIWKVLIILFLGLRPVGPAGDMEPLRAYVAREAPLYAEVDVAALRQMVEQMPELRKLVYEEQDPTRACDQAAAQLAGMLRTTPADVKRAFESLERVGFWLLAFGEDEQNLRLLLVLDCGRQNDLLPGLLKGLTGPGREGDVVTLSYVGTPIFHIGDGGEGVWLAQHEGKVAASMDLLAVQEFLLRAKSLAAQPPQPHSMGLRPPMLQAEANGGAMLDSIIAAVQRHDREEFYIVSSLLDFASWKSLTASFDGKRLEAHLHLDPNGRIAKALVGPEGPPRLLGAVPDQATIAAVVALRDPMALYKAIRASVRDVVVLEGAPEGAEEEFLEEIRREIGLDLERDVFGNIAEAAYMVGEINREYDLMEKALFAFETKDAAGARLTVEKMAAALAGGGREIEISQVAGAVIWRVGGAAIALKDATVLICEERNPLLNDVLQTLGRTGSPLAEQIQRQHPEATSVFVFDPARLAGLETVGGPMVAGLHFADDRLTLTADIDVEPLANALSRAMRREMTAARRTVCMANLRQIAMGVHMYAADNQGACPPNLNALDLYLGDEKLLVCPVSGKPYVYRNELAGRSLDGIQDAGRTVLAHDAPGAHPDGGCVLYVDGHVEWKNPEAFRQAIGE